MVRANRARAFGARGFVLFIAIALGLLFAYAPAARADDIPRLQGQITDLTRDGVLASGRGRIEPVLGDLLRGSDIQLFVLFVETTSSRTVTEFADETARVNSLGGNDALMLVALGDRTDALWRSESYLDTLTDRELETILSQQVEPRLRASDFAGAVIACVDGLGAAAGTAPQPGTNPPPATPEIGWLVLAVLLVVGGAVLWTVIASRRREQLALAARARVDAQRSEETNALLIRADESLRDAQEEMGYAEAQFSAADVAPYRDAVATASSELRAAFTIRQRLDDAIPEDTATRRGLVEEIAAHATKALAVLDEQRRRVDEMRDLERRAPDLLAQLPEQIAAVAARVPASEQTLAGLSRYAEANTAAVRANLEDARQLLARAESAVVDGQSALKKENASAAAKAVRAAQQELTEAGRLVDAIDALAAAVREAERTAPEQLKAAAAYVERARAALEKGGSADHIRRLSEARAALAQAESEISAARPNFFAAVKAAAAADAGADAILAELHQEEERREREARLVATHLQLARGSYDRAGDFIAPRRRVIATAARTRLAEAERHLESATQLLAAGDLAAADADAQRAQRLADEAWSLAQDDMREADTKGPWTAFPRGGPVIIPFPIPIGGGWHPGGGGGRFPLPGGIPRPGGGSVGGRW